jgi:hypothetical protein
MRDHAHLKFPDNRLLNPGAANPKIPTRLRNMANLFSVSKYPQFALYLALILGH